MRKTAEERFWAKVDKNGPLILKTRCWVWTGSKNPGGYGQFRTEGKTQKAHRWSYEFHKGPIQIDLHVCHMCDHRSCINPNHLFAGSRLDNMRDCLQKGRRPIMRGEMNGRTKLTESQILDIRSRHSYYGLNAALSREFNVTHVLISKIRSGGLWKHV